VWNDFKFRDNDIVIATCGKSGTTWTQQIVGQLLFNGDESVAVGPMSPWLDLRVPPKEIKYAGLGRRPTGVSSRRIYLLMRSFSRQRPNTSMSGATAAIWRGAFIIITSTPTTSGTAR
jgi:hypothetical protein